MRHYERTMDLECLKCSLTSLYILSRSQDQLALLVPGNYTEATRIDCYQPWIKNPGHRCRSLKPYGLIE